MRRHVACICPLRILVFCLFPLGPVRPRTVWYTTEAICDDDNIVKVARVEPQLPSPSLPESPSRRRLQTTVNEAVQAHEVNEHPTRRSPETFVPRLTPARETLRHLNNASAHVLVYQRPGWGGSFPDD